MISEIFELLRICWTFRHRSWYRRFPFLPLPSKRYLQWRIETAYGSRSLRNLRWHDVAAYARWHRAMRLNQSSPVVKNDIWD
ncbi:MAG: hypothetical protein FJW26_20390 [Acidimicrobiia bacterium]|nr:hypothetical protein [Acidimicrobiia bacterium]